MAVNDTESHFLNDLLILLFLGLFLLLGASLTFLAHLDNNKGNHWTDMVLLLLGASLPLLAHLDNNKGNHWTVIVLFYSEAL